MRRVTVKEGERGKWWYGAGRLRSTTPGFDTRDEAVKPTRSTPSLGQDATVRETPMAMSSSSVTGRVAETIAPLD